MKRLIAGIAVGFLLATSVGVATGAIPGPAGTISACYGTSVGVLRVVNDTRSCTRFETPLTWNQRGEPGPPGPAGPGKKSISGYVVASGAIEAGSGFTVTHAATGVYAINFPPGTWNGTTRPIPIVSTGNGPAYVARHGLPGAIPDGSAYFGVETSDQSGHLVDAGFFLHVIQS